MGECCVVGDRNFSFFFSNLFKNERSRGRKEESGRGGMGGVGLICFYSDYLLFIIKLFSRKTSQKKIFIQQHEQKHSNARRRNEKSEGVGTLLFFWADLQ